MLSLPLKNSECLYGAITRHWQMMGAPNSYRYKVLLGLPRRHRIHPYLPTHLGQIGSAFGIEPMYLLEEHTLYPLFRAATPDGCRLKESMLGTGTPSPVILCRLPHLGNGTPFTIKYCPVCIREERNVNGFAVWHLHHQIPGVMSCHKHYVELHHCLLGDGGADRNLKAIPSKIDLSITNSKNTDVALSQSAFALLEKCKNDLRSHQQLNTWINLSLRSLGMFTSGGYVRQDLLKKAISEIFSVNGANEFQVCNSTWFKACVVARQHTLSCSHPLAYAVLLYTIQMLQQSSSAFHHVSTKLKTKNLSVPKLLDDARSGMSINQLCTKYSRSKCFVTRQLELNGIEHATNSMATDDAIKTKVLLLAWKAVPRKKIAARIGVGIGLVDKLICNTPGLTEHRKYLRSQRNLTRCIKRVKKVCNENPDLSRTEIRNLVKAEYAILYKKDKSLLFSILPPAKAPKPIGRTKKIL